MLYVENSSQEVSFVDLFSAVHRPLGSSGAKGSRRRKRSCGEWSRNGIAEFLLKGVKPDSDNVQGLMKEVIEAGFKKMAREDALAIADYLKSIPPIRNKIK